MGSQCHSQPSARVQEKLLHRPRTNPTHCPPPRLPTGTLRPWPSARSSSSLSLTISTASPLGNRHLRTGYHRLISSTGSSSTIPRFEAEPGRGRLPDTANIASFERPVRHEISSLLAYL